MNNMIKLIATGFGSGLSPYAPGTMGTLVAIPIYYLLSQFSLPIYLIATIVIFLIGVPVSRIAAQEMKRNDPPSVVIDEIAGYLVTMIAAPVGWIYVLIGFGLFRLFDIWKPWPIKRIEQSFSVGWAIMLDDIMAAAYAFIGLQLLAKVIPNFYG